MLYEDANNDYSIWELCDALQIARSAYYHWLNGPKSERELTNDRLAQEILEIYEQHTDKGYRRIRDDLNRRYGEHVSDKRVLRLMRKEQIQSTINHPRNCCMRSASKPQYVAENILARDFHAERPNEKWVTDVTEFKFYDVRDTRKLYLSAILDLFDCRIVGYAIGDRNDNKHVYENRKDLVSALERYLHYYNFERLQRRLSIMTPQEYHNHYLAA